MAARYEQKAEADRDNLRRVVLYAQTALCRWKAVLDYFGETPEWERCDHCDNCERPIAEMPAMPPERRIVQPPSAKPEVLPLPPILGEKDPGSLQPGDTLTLTIFGTGEVREVSPAGLTVAFADGEVRQFRR